MDLEILNAYASEKLTNFSALATCFCFVILIYDQIIPAEKQKLHEEFIVEGIKNFPRFTSFIKTYIPFIFKKINQFLEIRYGNLHGSFGIHKHNFNLRIICDSIYISMLPAIFIISYYIIFRPNYLSSGLLLQLFSIIFAYALVYDCLNGLKKNNAKLKTNKTYMNKKEKRRFNTEQKKIKSDELKKGWSLIKLGLFFYPGMIIFAGFIIKNLFEPFVEDDQKHLAIFIFFKAFGVLSSTILFLTLALNLNIFRALVAALSKQIGILNYCWALICVSLWVCVSYLLSTISTMVFIYVVDIFYSFNGGALTHPKDLILYIKILITAIPLIPIFIILFLTLFWLFIKFFKIARIENLIIFFFEFIIFRKIYKLFLLGLFTIFFLPVFVERFIG